MIDIDLLRENPEKVKKGIAAKQADPKLVDNFLATDKQWKTLLAEVENIRAKHKKLGKEEQAEGRALKEEVKKLEVTLDELAAKRVEILETIPNLPQDGVPEGKDESENKVLRKWGEIPVFSFEPKDHVALGEALDIIDIERATKVSGARFNYLKGGAARLELALINFTFDLLTSEEKLKPIADSVEKGYSSRPFVPVFPPVMIRPDVFTRMARLSPEDKDERYHLEQDDLYLIGSAEHTLGAMHMDETLKEDVLPLRYVGFSTSFRREAGSYGKDTRGIIRMHQFDKVEMESFSDKENSFKEHNFFVAIQEHLLQLLKLPYQVVISCTGDLGKPNAQKIDMETWMPGQGKYRETHSADYMTDYQARRLATKVKRKSGETELVHTNDATAIAIGRTLIAIIENYQQADGSIKVPEVLQKYTGFGVIK
jgi:seryl-tRNA synthetase